MTRRQVIFILKNAGETVALGRALGEMMEPGDTLALTGDLGAGKTTLTQGIARGLGVDESYYITSPTFTLINEYPARAPLYHIDLYRLEGGLDADALGLEEYLESDGVTVVEWAERIGEENLPETTVWMSIEFIDADSRKITAAAKGAGERRLESWLNNKDARLFLQDAGN